MKYFHFGMTKDEAKSIFRELSKEFHPDSNQNNGSDDFRLLKAEYDDFKIIKNHWNDIVIHFAGKMKPIVVERPAEQTLKNVETTDGELQKKNIFTVLDTVNSIVADSRKTMESVEKIIRQNRKLKRKK